jgi:hypothetical protein
LHYNTCYAVVQFKFKLSDRVRRVGRQEVCAIEDIREPDDEVVRLNPGCETMYWIRVDGACVWAKESELELAD